MDFGDVLEEWERMERERARRKGVASIRGDAPIRRESADPAENEPESPQSDFAAWIDSHDIVDKDQADGDSPPLAAGTATSAGAEASAEREARARRLAAMPPQASIDLHGMNAREAEEALRRFFEDSSRQGLEKVLVIHGKGNHSKGEPVLKRIARKAIETSPWAGRSGEAERAQGGSGALWVAIRARKA